MANDITTDKLSLEVSVTGIQQKDINLLNELATALEKIKNATKGIKDVGANLGKVAKAVNVGRSPKPVPKGTAEDFSGLTQTETLEKQIKLLKEKQNEDTYTAEQKLRFHSQELNLQNKLNKLQKGESTLQKGNLLTSFKRVAIYRVIRAILKEIGQSVKESEQELARISPEVNKSLSQITSSLQVLKGSLGNIVISLLSILEPILHGLSVALGSISNAISRTVAELRGLATYTKVNTDYLKDYNAQLKGTLLSFDTFTTLSQGNDMSGLFSEEATNVLTQDLERGKTLLLEIVGILAIIEGMKLAKWISGGGLNKIGDSFGKLKTSLTEINSTALIVGSSIAWVTSILNLIEVISNWDNQSLLTKITAITGAVLGLASVIFAILSATGVGNVGVMKAISAGLMAGTLLATGISAMKFADGGMFEGAGTMYAVAGESGAEIVAQGSAGTGVLNVAQFKQAMVEALYEYGASRGNIENIQLTMDGNRVGKAVASSVGFRNEATRRGNSWR